VLGLAIGGLLFSLLTLLFSGVVPGLNPSTAEKFRSLVKNILQPEIRFLVKRIRLVLTSTI
jgi:hypothetical protein